MIGLTVPRPWKCERQGTKVSHSYRSLRISQARNELFTTDKSFHLTLLDTGQVWPFHAED